MQDTCISLLPLEYDVAVNVSRYVWRLPPSVEEQNPVGQLAVKQKTILVRSFRLVRLVDLGSVFVVKAHVVDGLLELIVEVSQGRQNRTSQRAVVLLE